MGRTLPKAGWRTTIWNRSTRILRRSSRSSARDNSRRRRTPSVETHVRTRALSRIAGARVRDPGGPVQLRRRLLLVVYVPFSMLHAQHTTATPELDASRVATDYLAAYTQRYPEAVSGTPATVLFDNRRSAYADWNRQEEAYLVRLRHTAPRLPADAPLALTLGVMQERLEASREFAICHRELWNVSPVTGWLSEYRGYAVQQHVQGDEGRRLALSRWSRLPDFIDTEIANLRYGLRTATGHRAWLSLPRSNRWAE